MSSGNQKDGVVIDVTPEQADPPESAPANQNAPASSHAGVTAERAGLLPTPGNLLGLLALALLVALLVFGYVSWANFRHDLAALDQRLSASLERQEALQANLREADQAMRAQQGTLAEQEAQLRASLAEYRETAAAQKRAYQQRERQLADEQSAAAAREAELRDAIADVHRRVGGSGSQWMVAEARYLTRLANHRLVLSHDINTALAALAQADQRLKDIRDAGWQDIRERLAHDITTLKAVVLPDYAALTEQLDRLIAKLPLTRNSAISTKATPDKPAQEEAQATTNHDRSWGNLVDDAVSGLKSAVRIRRHDQPLQPLPGSAQEFFDNQNLQLQLTTAQLALARRQAALYDRSLAFAAKILDALGAAGHQAARAMRIEINDLAAIAIAPPLPDLGATLRALEKRYQQRNGFPDADLAEPAGKAG